MYWIEFEDFLMYLGKVGFCLDIINKIVLFFKDI